MMNGCINVYNICTFESMLLLLFHVSIFLVWHAAVQRKRFQRATKCLGSSSTVSVGVALMEKQTTENIILPSGVSWILRTMDATRTIRKNVLGRA